MKALALLFLLQYAPLPYGTLDYMAANPDSANRQIILGHDSTGTVWKARARDLAQANRRNPVLWAIEDHSEDATEEARKSKHLYRLDCARRTIVKLSSVSYAPDGRVIDSFDEPYSSSRARHIVPDTMGETLEEWVCRERE